MRPAPDASTPWGALGAASAGSGTVCARESPRRHWHRCALRCRDRAPYPVSPHPALPPLPLGAPLAFKPPNPLCAGSLEIYRPHNSLTNSAPQKHSRAEIAVAPPSAPGRGPKPYDAVPRQPSQLWRGWEEQGMHVINIKSYLLQTEDLYCTSLTHIHKNTIYTERLGGAGALRGALRRPPLPPRQEGLYRRHVGRRRSRRADEHHLKHVWVEWSPRRAHHADIWRKAKRMERRGQSTSSSLGNPQSARGLRTLGVKPGPEKLLALQPRGRSPARQSLIRHFRLGVGSNCV